MNTDTYSDLPAGLADMVRRAADILPGDVLAGALADKLTVLPTTRRTAYRQTKNGVRRHWH